jgi:hypothetical protein
MSHTNNHNGTDDGGNSSSQNLIRKAVQYAGLSQQDRREWRRLLRRVDRVADPYLPPDDPAEPPRQFIDQLRRPADSKRQTIWVVVDNRSVALLLNPQGKADPERERWLWNYVRGMVQEYAR